MITLGGGVKKRVTLNTHSVQQKNQAARIIYEFAVSLRGNLRNYIIPSLQALLQLVTEKHSADIRSSASLAISKTFDAYLHAIAIGSLDNSEVVDVLNSCVAKLLEALKGEINSTSRTCAAESLRDVLTACYTSGVETADGLRDDFLAKPSLDVSKAIANDVMKQCGDCLQRRKEKELAVSKHEGYDAEDVANSLIEELEEEDELLSILVDAIGFLLKLHGEAFMDYFDQTVAPAFSVYLSPSQPEALQAVAVCLVDDAIEFGGSSSLKYISNMLPVLLRNSQSEHVTLRQCSVYGIAKACCVAPELIKDYLVPVINCIMEMIDDPLADEEEKVGATENAIFALGAICTNPIYREAIATASKEDRANGATAINISNFMSRWLTHLPLKNDEQEAKMAHKLLCDVIEQNDSVVMGDNFSNLKEILRIIAEVLESSSPYVTPYSSPTKTVWSDINSPQSMASSPSRCSNPDDESLAHPSTIIRMQAIIRQFTSMTGTFTDKLQSAFSSLAPQLQDTLKAIL